MLRRPEGLTFSRLFRQTSLFALLIAMLMLAPAVASGAEPTRDEATKNVLVFTSYDLTLPDNAIANEIICATLRKDSPVHIQFYQEFMVSSRILAGRYEEVMVSLLRQKYEGMKIDLILALGAPALQLLLKHRNNLLPDTPIIFYFLDETEEFARHVWPKAVGVWAKPEYGKTLEVALTVHPETEKVVVVAGNSAQDRFFLEKAQKEFRKYEGRVEFTYQTDLTIEELRQELASLPEKSIVIFLSFFSDRAGNFFLGPEALSLLAPSSSAPIYGIAQTYLGHGIVGGSLLDFEAIGKQIGELGLRVLSGEKPQDIFPPTVPTVTMFDWRILRRWEINKRRLPPGSLVQFKEPSFWELYKYYIVAFTAASLIEALFIARLLINRSRYRQAEEENLRLARLAEDQRRNLDDLISSMPGILCESRLDSGSPEMKVRFVSNHIEKLLGYSVDEWLSTPGFMQSIIYEEDREEFARQRDRGIASGKQSIFQFRWKAKDGRVLWAETYMTPYHDEKGEVVGLRGVTIDITERKLAEQALHDSENKTRDILRALPDMMFLQSPNGVYLDYHASDTYCLFVPPEDFLGKNMRDILPPELSDAFWGCFQRAKRTGELQVLEYTLAIKGEWRWYEARIIHTNADQILSIVRDITQRKRAEAQVIESEQRFRNMADTAPVMIWLSDPNMQCIYFNKRWLDFTGRSIEEELGSGWAEGAHKEDYQRCLETYERAFERREAFTMEYRLRRADGQFRWVRDSAVARFSSDGKFLGYIGSCVDVTDIKQTEEALKEAFAEVSKLKSQLEAENIYLQEEIQIEHNFNEMIGNSEAIRKVLLKIEQVAPTDTTVLILGETGTGKELVARAIHSTSLRKDKPLIKVNCATLPATLIESELFGHERGAFTSATARQLGRFELANGGTIFLDEIGDLPPEMQVKLLRVLQEGEFERLGSGKTIKVDIRIIAATNRNLPMEIQKGLFREDLWYRLHVFPITVPPLRDRPEDIPLLVEAFARKFSKELGKSIEAITPATMRDLQVYSWPGNIRELANVIERAVINTEGAILRLAERLERPQAIELPFARQTLKELERDYILRVLEQTGWRIEGPKGAARVLGLNPSTLRTRMAKVGIRKPEDDSQS